MTRNAVSAVLMIALVACATSAAWAKEEPEPTKVEILQPQADQILKGTVDVRLKIVPGEPGSFPSSVHAGLGGPPWVEMERVEGTDQWQCQLDSTMVPNRSHDLIVKTADRRASGAIRVKVENPLQCFFADLHSHTSYSDGTLIPAVAHDYAREVAKLDVFLLTDHLEQVDDVEWSDAREVALKANADGEFVAMPGLEWTKKQGHMNIFDPKSRHWPDDTAAFYKAAAAAGVVAKFNHPGDGTEVFDGLAYSEIGDKAVQMMEVRRPEEEQAYMRALKLGWHIAPDGSDDTHAPNWGNNRSWTGILAPALSKRNVWHALENRHCFSSHDRNCELLFTLNGAVMGDILAEPVKTVEIVAAVDEADQDDLIAKIELLEDGSVIQTDEPKSAHRRWETTCSPQPGKHYYFVKVTQADGNLMWSAPVWVTVAGE